MLTPNAQIDEDAIDLEDLQAQIDLSMSFAQNLVISWVKPVHYSQTNRQRELENEIKEFMRRPARLGVGAPTPENQSFSRTATKLKSRFEHEKKRRRDDEDTGAKKSQSDNEEESRTDAIKKKPRVDPFSVRPKQQKHGIEFNGKGKTAMHPAAMEVMSKSQLMPTEAEDGLEVDEVAMELLISSDSLETRNQPKSALLDDDEITAVGTGPPLGIHRHCNLTKRPSLPSASTTALQSAVTPLAHQKGVISSKNPSHPPIRHPISASFAGQPLLNLHGPPSEDDSEKEENLNPSQFSLLKKKRKRRKKKHSQQITETPSTQA